MSGRRILVVCTANVCRSPLVAAVLQHALDAHAADVAVTSAGTRRVKLPVDPQVVRILKERGIDASGHHPRVATSSIIKNDGADLIVTMTREHVREIVNIERSAWTRTFTLHEIVRRGDLLGHAGAAATAADQDGDPAATFRGWLERVGHGRRPIDLLHGSSRDDIEDPYGQSRRVLRRVTGEIDDLCARFVAMAPR